MPVKAMVLAAGEGKRLGTTTSTLPKPMVPIGGRPLLEHTIATLGNQDVRELVINLHHCPDVIRAHFGDGAAWGVRISYSPEAVLLGTAGALKGWRSFFDDTFLVVYGDNLLRCEIAPLMEFHKGRAAAVTAALLWRDDPWQSGIADVAADGRIRRFLEKPRPEELFSRWVSAGLLVLEPEMIDLIPPGPADFGRDVLPRWIAEGHPVCGYKLPLGQQPRWIDTPEDLASVQAEMRETGS